MRVRVSVAGSHVSIGRKAAAAPEHLAVLDGLRGLAIVLVVVTHSYVTNFRPAAAVGPVAFGLEPVVLGGSLGVELFFFISGFVLFLPYARAMCGERAFPTFAHFVDRRISKIVPSYWLAVVLTAFLFFAPADVEARRAVEIARHLAFVHSFWRESIFALVSAFWSLAIEVQFYVLFPALAAAMRRAPWVTYAAALGAGEGFRLWLHASGRNQDFFFVCQLPAQIDLFVLGMLCAWLFARNRGRLGNARVERGATILAVAALAFGLWLIADFSHVTKNGSIGDHQAWQSDHRLVVGFTIAALALGSLFAARAWRRVVANAPLVWLSGISYNLYLWHEAILTQCANTGFPCSGIATPWASDPHWTVDFFWTYVGLSVAVAAAVTYGFERPLLRLGTGGLVRLARAYQARARNAVVRVNSHEQTDHGDRGHRAEERGDVAPDGLQRRRAGEPRRHDP